MMNRTTTPTEVQTYRKGNITIDLELQINQQVQRQGIDKAELLHQLNQLIVMLEREKEHYNINPYPEKFNRGVYILGRQTQELGIFPTTDLVMKCSEARWNAEDPRKQFFRSIQLIKEFETKLNDKEKALLQVCPVYLHFCTRRKDALFKRVLLMPKIQGTPLGDIETGFNAEFCHVFQIPMVQEIRRQRRFWLHRLLDPNQQRQLLKIQSAYLFQRLFQKGIRIPSLNQKNILALSSFDRHSVSYTIIDPVADYGLPISPAYNLLTAALCSLPH